MMKINKYKIFILVLIYFYFPFYSSLFSSNYFYIENNQYYNLLDYRSNQISSKSYFRNLISFYFYDKKNQSEILNYLKNKNPEFYWLAEQLWENKFLKNSLNPSIKIWIKYLNLYLNDNIDYTELKNDCEYFGEMFCNWILNLDYIYQNYKKINKKINYLDYQDILKRLEPFLTKSVYIPFMYSTGNWLPEYLREMGLNLESAILLKKMMFRVEGELKNTILKELILSIALSGDPLYAIKVQLENGIYHFSNLSFNTFNLLNLSKDYDTSINILKQDLNYSLYYKDKDVDIWTKLPITKYLIKIRMADLIYWNKKNPNEAIILLERLINNKELTTIENLYARLIQSRILYINNIQLSQKIAEDVEFKSQEKDLFLIEYYSTIWNGWCLYKLKKYYQANIEFTKAYNIYKRHFTNISSYSVLLGLLLTKRTFNITDLNIIDNLKEISNKYIPDEYFFYTMEWIPEDIHYDIWKDIWIEYLSNHNKNKEMINFILSEYKKPLFFEQSKNPGGISGLYTNYLYCLYLDCKSTFNYQNNFDNNFIDNIFTLNKTIVLFYSTTKYYYVFVVKNKKTNVLKFTKDQNSKWELLNNLQKDYNDNLLFILNPHVDITHLDILKIYKDNVQFALLYSNQYKIKNFLEKQNYKECSIDQDSIVLSKKVKKYPGYPYLTKFICSDNKQIRLWDLERFYPDDKKFIFYNMENRENDVEFYQIIYYIAMNKNWFLEEIYNQGSIVFYIRE